MGLALGLMTTACGPGLGPSTGTGEGSGGSTAASSSSGASAEVTGVASTTMAGGTTAVGTTASVDESTDGGGAFYGGSPDGPLPDCDLFEQDCPEGEKCSPYASQGVAVFDATRCLDVVESPAQAGEPCTIMGSAYSGRDDCDAGLVCYQADPETSTGVCRELCEQGRSDCLDPDTACTWWYDGGLPVCSPICDGLLQDCGPGLACMGEPEILCDFATCGISRPDLVDLGQQGDGCIWATDCALGLQCADGATVPGCGDSRCCTEICDAGVLESCDGVPGTNCIPLGARGCPPQLYFTGVCIAP